MILVGERSSVPAVERRHSYLIKHAASTTVPSQSLHVCWSLSLTLTLYDTVPSFLSVICNCQLPWSPLECWSPPPVTRPQRRSTVRRAWPALPKVEPPSYHRPHQRHVIIPRSRPPALQRRIKSMNIAVKQLCILYCATDQKLGVRCIKALLVQKHIIQLLVRVAQR